MWRKRKTLAEIQVLQSISTHRRSKVSVFGDGEQAAAAPSFVPFFNKLSC